MFCKKVMVIGAGTMGSGIAQVFAQNGCEVILNDIKQEFIDGGKAKIDKSLTKLVSKWPRKIKMLLCLVLPVLWKLRQKT